MGVIKRQTNAENVLRAIKLKTANLVANKRRHVFLQNKKQCLKTQTNFQKHKSVYQNKTISQKHKPISQSTNQFTETQNSFSKHKPISRNTNQFTETQNNVSKH